MLNFFKSSRLLIMVSFFVWSLDSMAKTQNYEFASYKEAKSAESFIRFDMSSTKLGLITTSFQGHIKRFALTGDIQSDKLNAGALVAFAVVDMDTDNSSRNEKMWSHCFDHKNHPKLQLVLRKELPVNGESAIIPATLSLRGIEKPLNLTGKAQRTSKGVEFDFSGDLSLKDLGIPDPSIVIATVRDTIKVTAHFVIPQP